MVNRIEKEDEDQTLESWWNHDGTDQTEVPYQQWFLFPSIPVVFNSIQHPLRWRREGRLVLHAGELRRTAPRPELLYAKRIAVVWPAKICAMVLSSWICFFSFTWWPFTLLYEQLWFLDFTDHMKYCIDFFIFFFWFWWLWLTSWNKNELPTSLSARTYFDHELRKIHMNPDSWIGRFVSTAEK